jgi:hypothetical protein
LTSNRYYEKCEVSNIIRETFLMSKMAEPCG